MMNHPIWGILEYRDLSMGWLARRIGYSHSQVKNVRYSGATATPEFRKQCARVLDLPESVLFFTPDRTDGAPSSQPIEAGVA
jgi:hypothetical protein